MTKNILYPGRPNYTGPIKGLFGFIHHDMIAELSHDVRERVAFIERNKPSNEIKHRLHCLVYLSPRKLPTELNKALRDCNKYTKRCTEAKFLTNKIWGIYVKAGQHLRSTLKRHQRETLSLITKLVPDHTWNGSKLVMP